MLPSPRKGWHHIPHSLTERVSDKVDPDDPVGDLSAGGPVWHLALTFRHDFE